MLSAPLASSRVPASQARGQTYAFHTCCFQPCPSQPSKGTDLCFPHLLRPAMSQPSKWDRPMLSTPASFGHVPAKQCYIGCNSTPYRNSPMPSAPVASSHVPAKQYYIGRNSTPYRNSPMPSAPVASSHVPAKQCYIGREEHSI